MTLPIFNLPSVPQTVKGVAIDPGSGGGSTPAPLTSEALAYFSADPVAVGAQTVFSDASLVRAVVQLIVQVGTGSSVALWDGPVGNPGASTLVVGVNGTILPGLTSFTLNCKQKVGPEMWLLTAGQPGVQVFVSYTGTQQ